MLGRPHVSSASDTAKFTSLGESGKLLGEAAPATAAPQGTRHGEGNADRLWLGALDRPTEIPNALLTLKNTIKQPLRLPTASGQASRVVSSLRSVVIPSIQKRQQERQPLTPAGSFGPLAKCTHHRASKVLQNPFGHLHKSMPNLGDKGLGGHKGSHGKDLGAILGNGSIRIAVMGPRGCGKTALVNRFVEGTFSEDYYPTTEVRYRKTVMLDSDMCTLELIDTSDNFRQREAHYYEVCHGFVLVFDVNDPASFDKLREILNLIELTRGHSRTPLVIVGTQQDKENPERSHYQEYLSKARKMGIEFVFSVSAMSPRCANVFYVLARLIRDHYLQVWAEDAKSFNPNAPGLAPDASRPSSVKSAPAGKTHRRSAMQVSDVIRRSQSVSSLSKGDGGDSGSRSGRGLVGGRGLRTLSSSLSLGGKQSDSSQTADAANPDVATPVTGRTPKASRSWSGFHMRRDKQ